MKLVDRYTVKRREPERISQVDYVDRTGFIPLDVQYERMRTAGEELSILRAYQYNTDLDKLNELDKTGDIGKLNIDEVSSDIKTSKLDKVVLDQKLKEHMAQYRQFKDKVEELNTLQDRYRQALREKELMQQAINEYKSTLV